MRFYNSLLVTRKHSIYACNNFMEKEDYGGDYGLYQSFFSRGIGLCFCADFNGENGIEYLWVSSKNLLMLHSR